MISNLHFEFCEDDQSNEPDEQSSIHCWFGMYPQSVTIQSVLQVIKQKFDLVTFMIGFQCFLRIFLTGRVDTPVPGYVFSEHLYWITFSNHVLSMLCRTAALEVRVIVFLMSRIEVTA